jgi:TrmH family RNA methyltransferase
LSLSKNEIKFYKSLQQKKFRDSEKLFVIEGVKLFKELLNAESFEIDQILIIESSELIDELQAEHGKYLTVISNNDLERISSFKHPNQVFVTVNQKEDVDLSYSEDELILFLDDVRDPGNLGTIIRTAEWFGVNQIRCSSTSVELYNPKVVQSSMGSIFRMKVSYGDLVQEVTKAQAANFSVIAADMNGEDLNGFEFEAKTVLVMGSESHGVSDEIGALSKAITIPKIGAAESLNVAMATGIILAAARR